MQNHPIQLTDVIYNAANQSFEALVTLHDGNNTQRYACAINAPITMPFEEATKGLKRQAQRRREARGGMRSQIAPHLPPQRAGRPAMEALRWLENILHLTGRRTA